MEESNALKEVENSLRDFSSSIMTKAFGENWVEKSGISPDRIIIWKERREIENKKQKFSTPEKRIIYYSDFYDLATILDKNWNLFEEALGDKKTISLFLKILDDFRNPDAHRRELLPHQKYLILGISGEIRNRIILYRSKKETGEDYFPRIESIRDNLGNSWVPEDLTINPKLILRPDDILTFVITATDPLGESLEYCCYGETDWHKDNCITIKIENRHIAKRQDFVLSIRSLRDYHAKRKWDDAVIFSYMVLPKK